MTGIDLADDEYMIKLGSGRIVLCTQNQFELNNAGVAVTPDLPTQQPQQPQQQQQPGATTKVVAEAQVVKQEIQTPINPDIVKPQQIGSVLEAAEAAVAKVKADDLAERAVGAEKRAKAEANAMLEQAREEKLKEKKGVVLELKEIAALMAVLSAPAEEGEEEPPEISMPALQAMAEAAAMAKLRAQTETEMEALIAEEAKITEAAAAEEAAVQQELKVKTDALAQVEAAEQATEYNEAKLVQAFMSTTFSSPDAVLWDQHQQNEIDMFLGGCDTLSYQCELCSRNVESVYDTVPETGEEDRMRSHRPNPTRVVCTQCGLWRSGRLLCVHCDTPG